MYTKDELEKKTSKELVEIAKDNAIEVPRGTKKSELVVQLLELEAPDDDLLEEDDEELVEEDDNLEEDEDLDEEDDELADIDEELEEDELEEKPTKATKKASAKKPAAKKAPAADGDTMAAKQVAFELSTEAKTLRQFFRSPASTVEAVGSGGRYEFATTDLPQIKEEFEKWRSEHAARGSKRGPGKAKSSTPVDEIEEVEEIEELEDNLELDEDDELDLEEED